MTPPPQLEYIITNEGLAELDKYFIEHKDDLIRIAWKNLRDAHILPYQSSRDMVDNFLTKILERCDVEVDEDTYQVLSYQRVSLDEILHIHKEFLVEQSGR
jgi:hypothetical protein